MASTDIIDSWIPIEWDGDVIQRVQRESAIEQLGYRVPMNTATKRILRSAGMTVTAGTTYTDDTSTNDYITLTARRLISKFTVDEDDLADASTIVDTIRIKGMDWAISYSDAFDNACLGVSAAENGSTVPFTSAYKSLRTTNSATSYTADDNYLHESIMNPQAKVVKGFGPPSIMPPFQGQLSEEQILQLIAYIRTLKPAAGAPAAAKQD